MVWQVLLTLVEYETIEERQNINGRVQHAFVGKWLIILSRPMAGSS